MQRLRETGTIDNTLDGKNIGLIIDHHNQTVEKASEKDFNREITARNKYYWKLWREALKEMGTNDEKVYRLKQRNNLARR